MLTSILVYYTFLILHIFKKKNVNALFLFHRDDREFVYAIPPPDTVEFGYVINEKTLD